MSLYNKIRKLYRKPNRIFKVYGYKSDINMWKWIDKMFLFVEHVMFYE